MGGHRAGDVASSMAIQLFHDYWKQTHNMNEPKKVEKWLHTNVGIINERIYAYSQQHAECNGMGTTLIIAICTSNFVTIGHIGDSRCYMVSEGKMTLVTEDHSLVNELVRHGEISKEDAEYHSRAFETFRGTNDRPTLIIVDSHIGYGAPNKQDTAAAHGEPLGEEEIRLDQAQLRLARGREVPGSRRRMRALRGRLGERAPPPRDDWMAMFDATSPSTPSSPTTSTGCSGASCPTAGTGICRRSRPTPRAWPRATPRARCSTRSRKNVPWLIGGSADLAPRPRRA